jgi:ABC-type glycerol-3-phosphate transport system substrate-binding protein
MTQRPRARPAGIGRRGFLAFSAAAAGGLVMLPRRALAQGGELTMWTPGGSPVFCAMHDGLLQGWAAGNGVTTATLQCGLGANEEYAQVLLGAIAGGNAPDLSIVWDSPIALGARGAFTPLDDMLPGTKIAAETWPAGLLSSCQYGGKTFGLPVTAGLYGMFYNQELFEAKGMPSDRASLPKTWDEMRAMSKEFTVWNGDRLEVAGFMPPRINVIAILYSGLNGARIYDAASERYTIDDERNIEMFNFFIDWLDEEYRGDINLIDRSGNFNDGYPDTTTGLGPAFREGRMAGIVSGSWLMGDIYADPTPTFTRWDVADLPAGPSGSGPRSGFWPNWMVIPAGAKNVETAFRYLEFISTEGVVDWYRVVPDIPTNANAEQVLPTVVVDNRGEEFAADITAFWAEQAKIVTPMWDSPVEAFGQDQLARAMEKIYTRAASPKDALTEAQLASQAELERFLAN